MAYDFHPQVVELLKRKAGAADGPIKMMCKDHLWHDVEKYYDVLEPGDVYLIR